MGMTFQDEEYVKRETDFLKNLVVLEKSVNELQNQYKGYQDWDEEEPLYILSRENMITVLKKFLEYDISAKDMHWWAETVIYSPTLQYQKGYHDIIAEIIAKIHANGELGEAINRQEAEEYIRQLRNAQFDPNYDTI